MKTLKIYLFILTLIGCTSCITEDVPSNTPTGNFEALWKIIDDLIGTKYTPATKTS